MKCSQRRWPRSWSGLHRADASNTKKLIDCLLIKMLRIKFPSKKKIRENGTTIQKRKKKKKNYQFFKPKKILLKNLPRGRGPSPFFSSPPRHLGSLGFRAWAWPCRGGPDRWVPHPLASFQSSRIIIQSSNHYSLILIGHLMIFDSSVFLRILSPIQLEISGLSGLGACTAGM